MSMEAAKLTGLARVAGVGMVPFATPRKSASYDAMAEGAIRAALSDSGIEYALVQQVYAGYVYGDSACGQRSVFRVGMTGVPVVNVNNNCSTGSSALWLARQAVESGAADCVLALGFEQMRQGAIRMLWDDRPSVVDRFSELLHASSSVDETAPLAAQFFDVLAVSYMDKYDVNGEAFAAVAVKARKHAANNPYAVFREQISLEDVMSSPAVGAVLTRLQCCPPTCGAAAAVVCSEEFARRHGLSSDVAIKAQALVSDTESTFDGDMANLVGCGISRNAADQVYERSGVAPEDVDVVELHDCFTSNELVSYEALGLTPEGTAAKFIADGDNTYGGRVVTNPSGGLLSKGHPIGATGLAQCAELTWQLRGQAGSRQVVGAKLALQHNVGLGGAAVVTLYEKVS